ncbi:MAG TPA: O-antigen ligase family protein [Nodosilinea sp.]|nr:O-antigen ligase family protein [Nodosilinea sp.]
MAPDTALQQTAPATLKGRWLGAFGVLAMVAMTWLPHSYLRMVSWPWALVWQLGFLAFGLWLVWLLRQFQLPVRPLGHGLDWAMAATGLSLILCSLASDFKMVALWNGVLVTGYGFALYAGAIWARLANIKATQLAVPLVGTVLGTALMSLVLWRPGAEAEPASEFYAALRNAMPFGHHNFVGGYFALALPVVLACAIALGGWQRWLAAVTTGLAAIALYLSGSRGALLGVGVWALVAGAAYILGSSAKGRGRRLLVGAAGLAAMTAVLASNPRVRSLVGGLNLANPTGPVALDGPLLDRYFMAKTALNIWRDRPLVGVGPGAMSRVSNLYRPIEAGLGLDHVRQLHSTPAQLVGEMGGLGMVVYLLWIVLLVRLWLHLHRTVEDQASRWLLYGAGGGLLAYGVSSLTDYQLENIGISMLLVALVLVLLCLADQAPQTVPPQPVNGATRRYLSLGLLAWLAIACYLWLMANLGFWSAHRALGRAEQGDVAGSLQQLAAAAAFVPWDPTYHSLAGQEIYRLLPLVPPDQQAAVRQDTLANLYQAATIAPNDAWFNHNLAALLLPQDPAGAEAYASRAVQLLPRERGFSRYLLGQTYLAQGKTAAAITAFSLEGLTQPEFLTLPLWQAEPLAALQPPVLAQALAYHERVLAAMSPKTPGCATFYNQTALVRWWHRQPPLATNADLLRPLTQALLATDQSAEAALAIVAAALASSPQDQGLLLLRAWLAPDEFAQPYLGQANLAQADKTQLAASFSQYRDARDWLTALSAPAALTGRSLLGLTYRNRYAQGINFIAPLGLTTWVIPTWLGLFSELPREFFTLDQTVDVIQTEQLNLPSAAKNGFNIVPPPPLPKTF